MVALWLVAGQAFGADTVRLELKAGAPAQPFTEWTPFAETDALTVSCKTDGGCRMRNQAGDTAPLTTSVDLAKSIVTFGFKAGADLSTNFRSMKSTRFVLQMNKADLTEQLAAKIGATGSSTDR